MNRGPHSETWNRGLRILYKSQYVTESLGLGWHLCCLGALALGLRGGAFFAPSRSMGTFRDEVSTSAHQHELLSVYKTLFYFLSDTGVKLSAIIQFQGKCAMCYCSASA